MIAVQYNESLLALHGAQSLVDIVYLDDLRWRAIAQRGASYRAASQLVEAGSALENRFALYVRSTPKEKAYLPSNLFLHFARSGQVSLAIADPEHPGRYLVGIECDGSAYHAARSALDRVRQAAREDHGWILHRVWATDWLQRPKEQLERAVTAIQSAKAELEARGERPTARKTKIELVTVERKEVAEIGPTITELTGNDRLILPL